MRPAPLRTPIRSLLLAVSAGLRFGYATHLVVVPAKAGTQAREFSTFACNRIALPTVTGLCGGTLDPGFRRGDEQGGGEAEKQVSQPRGNAEASCAGFPDKCLRGAAQSEPA